MTVISKDTRRDMDQDMGQKVVKSKLLVSEVQGQNSQGSKKVMYGYCSMAVNRREGLHFIRGRFINFETLGKSWVILATATYEI